MNVGIDPGLKGGIAYRFELDTNAFPMPTAGGEIDPGALCGILGRIQDRARYDIRVAVEKVGSMPGQGVSSTFKFGTGYGMIRGVCAALGISVTLVTPQAWKKAVLAGLPHDKDGAIRYCASRWPSLSLVQPRCRVPHDGMADALCLAAWMERQP